MGCSSSSSADASELDAELSAALKGPSSYDRLMKSVRDLFEPLGCYLSIPPYQPENQDWEITFSAIGLDYKEINTFYKVRRVIHVTVALFPLPITTLPLKRLLT